VTGFGGTLAPVLASSLQHRGWQVTGWDRARHPPADHRACVAHLEAVAPDAVFHLAMGSEDWAGRLAHWCGLAGARFVYTSSAMVFDRQPDGPHAVADERTARADYGRYKIRCEDAVLGTSAGAIVARMGWQIGTARGGNQMLEALSRMAEVTGVVRASTAWRPACSFMDDTADALIGLAESGEPGVFHLDSNATDALTFFEIAGRLARLTGADWKIVAATDYVHDQRLLDERVSMPGISLRLPA
jgi:dTDP-4-dehydrorhamnose reductase